MFVPSCGGYIGVSGGNPPVVGGVGYCVNGGFCGGCIGGRCPPSSFCRLNTKRRIPPTKSSVPATTPMMSGVEFVFLTTGAGVGVVGLLVTSPGKST